MFDSVLGRGAQPSRVFFRGAIVSVTVHVVVLGLGVYLSVHKPKAMEKPIAPMVLLQPPPLQPPAPRPPAVQTPSVPAKPVQKKPNIIQDTETPPVEKDPAPTQSASSAEPGPSTGDTSNASGAVGGTGTGPSTCGGIGQPPCGTAPPCGGPGQPCAPEGGETVLPFIPGMVRPTLVSGDEMPTPPREAIMAKVEGLVLASCTITATGNVTHCRIIKGLPYMDDAILSNLQARKYTPIMYQGRPVSVEYKFPFRIVAQ
ncbi:energy transducer TonB [Pendulispora brunnea]|uniref:Energy transducer TonB n=1 Tax=Pendulispora brunnea TaxID=2905690 RepID=A0ABZ2JWD7_9BACT